MFDKDHGFELYIAVILAIAAAAVSTSRNIGSEQAAREVFAAVISPESPAFAAASDDTPDLTVPP